MKKILISSILFFSLSAYAQIDSTNASADTSKMKFIEPPDSTGFGVPDGRLVSKEIGPAGGTIVAEDGRVELIFPADALTANTNITIQPITNLAPNGAGKAYDFEPSGIQFKKPVQIIVHYTDKEAKACPPELMGLVIQDDRGKWSFFDYDDWDSVAKILRGSIEHFSRGANSYKFKLKPGKTAVMVNEEIPIVVSGTYKKFKQKPRPLSQSSLASLFYKWYVNLEEGGSASVGVIRNIKDNSCSYQAPGNMPTVNPVTIEVYISNQDAISCEVAIYDGYKITINAIWKDFSFGEIHADFKESSSFIIKCEPGNKWTADPGDIKNTLLLLDGPLRCPRKCNCKYVNESTCIGLLNIDKVTNVKISGENDSRTMLISFEKTKGMLPLISGDGNNCPKVLSVGVPPAPGVPASIELKLDGSDQPKQEPFEIGQLAFVFQANILVTRLKPGGQ